MFPISLSIISQGNSLLISLLLYLILSFTPITICDILYFFINSSILFFSLEVYNSNTSKILLFTSSGISVDELTLLHNHSCAPQPTIVCLDVNVDI